MTKIGFIGCGKIAGAIIKGIISSGYISPEKIMASKSNRDSLEEKSKELGIKITFNNKEIVNFGDIIFIAVKPNQVKAVIEEIKTAFSPKKLLVSVAAGIKTCDIEAILPNIKVIRVMPNTPIILNEGMTGITGGKNVTASDIKKVQNIFDSIGKSVVIDEKQMDIVTAISGSGPAFFYKIINDIAHAGEKLGLDYEKSLLLSIQTAIGAGKMALNRDLSMEELISNVATKGGCTRVGIDEMEAKDTAKIFYDVVKSTAEKAKTLG